VNQPTFACNRSYAGIAMQRGTSGRSNLRLQGPLASLASSLTRVYFLPCKKRRLVMPKEVARYSRLQLQRVLCDSHFPGLVLQISVAYLRNTISVVAQLQTVPD